MACNHPIPAYLSKAGGITFNRNEAINGPDRFVWLPCRMCRGCKIDKAREWAIRCHHEAQLHDHNSFVTLTYGELHLPPHGSLSLPDVQKFFKRLRKRIAPQRIRYYLGAEYGDKRLRPHYHLILFGYDFPDKFPNAKNKRGDVYYRSPLLESVWPYGHATIGQMTHDSARYCAQYTDKKINGKFQDHIDPETGLRPYERMDDFTGEIIQLKPEFQLHSVGLGFGWLEKYWKDIYPSDQVVIDGQQRPVPEGYDHWLKKHQPEVWEEVRQKRLEYARSMPQPTGLRQHQIAKAKDHKLDKYERPLDGART